MIGYPSAVIYSCLVLLLACSVSARGDAFTMTYFGGKEQAHVVNGHMVSTSAPTAVQIADLYARLSGNAPILHEGKTL
jgi:hypothetical protein